MIQVTGDILEAFRVYLDMTEEEFEALSDREQKDAIIRSGQLGQWGWGAERDLCVDDWFWEED